MFLLAFALGLREIERSDDGRVAIVVGLAVITAGMIAAYSYPGVIWSRSRSASGSPPSSSGPVSMARPGRPPRLVHRLSRSSLVVLALLGLAMLPRAIDFLRSGAWDTITGTNSKLRFVVSPLESLGIWPSGAWLDGTQDVTAYWVFGAIGLAPRLRGDLVGGPPRPRRPLRPRRGDRRLRGDAGRRHGPLRRRRRSIPASLVMLIVLLAFSPGGAWPKGAFAVVFVALAAYSSFLALRDTVVAPNDRFDELSEFRDEIDGQRVLSLTSDRFADYGLRTAEVQPGRERGVQSRHLRGEEPAAAGRLRLGHGRGAEPVPLRGHHRRRLSEPGPPGWALAKSSESYKLWKRTGVTPTKAILAEEARPGRVFRCENPKFRKTWRGEALVWPRPVIAKRLYWERDGETDNRLAPGEETGHRSRFRRGLETLCCSTRAR